MNKQGNGKHKWDRWQVLKHKLMRNANFISDYGNAQ